MQQTPVSTCKRHKSRRMDWPDCWIVDPQGWNHRFAVGIRLIAIDGKSKMTDGAA
jgi:hypothetical protein